MFQTPVSTIRDVSELTETSPTVIARILQNMRGPGEMELVHTKLDDHEARLGAVESRLKTRPKVRPTTQHDEEEQEWNRTSTSVKSATATASIFFGLFLIVIVALLFIGLASRSFGHTRHVIMNLNGRGGHELRMYDDNSVWEVVDGKEQPASAEDVGYATGIQSMNK